MTVVWPHGTVRLLLRELAGPEISSAFVAWAVRALSDGHDCQSLRVLAGLDLGGIPSGFEAAARFRDAIRELGLPDVDPPTLMSLFVKEVSGAILTGALEPWAAVELIHCEVLSPFHYPGKLGAWTDLFHEFAPHTHTPLDADALNMAIQETAQAWVSGSRRTKR